MPNTTASATSFLSTLGVNGHSGNANGAYANASLVIASLDYLGINTVRDSLKTIGTGGAVVNAMAASGIKFDFVTSSGLPATGASGLAGYVAALDDFQARHPGSIVAVEGLNEINTQPFSYNGDGSLTAAVAYQKALYTAVKANAGLAGVSVINLSVALESPSAYAAIGDLGAYSDYANAHAYTASGGTADKVMEDSMARAAAAAKGDKVIITETGYTTLATDAGLGVNQSAQAKLTVNSLLNAFENGSSQTFLYELFDSNLNPDGSEKEFHFGLFNVDGSPKLAATAVHNLTSLLSYVDAGTGTSASAAGAYSLSGLPADGHSMALTKANGAYDIMVWRDTNLWNTATQTETAVAAQTVTVDLGGVQKTVYVYDPLKGTTPIATYTNVSKITLAVGDHALVVEVGSKSAYSDPVTVVPASLSTTADGLVAQIDKLAGSTGLQSVTLTGGSVLSVASVATMRYMIANYGDVLAKVSGGYSFMVTETGDGWKEDQSFDSKGVLVSTADYGYVGGVISNIHTEFAGGVVSDQSFTTGKLSATIVNDPKVGRTVTSYDITTGKPTVMAVTNADGSSAATVYKNGIVSTYTAIAANGSRITDTFDTAGKRVSEVTVDTANVWTTSQFDANGAVTRKFIQRPDGSSEGFSYNLTGLAYATEHQVVNAKGVVTLVERSRADGTLVTTAQILADGGKVSSTYGTKGQVLTRVTNAADGSVTSLTYDATTAKLSASVVQTTAATTTISYTAGVMTDRTVVRADGSRVSETFDMSGMKTREVDVDTAKTYTTQVFDATTGKPQRTYVQYADGRSIVTSYNVTGKSYVTETQTTDKAGKVVSVVRSHADGTPDYTDSYASDGVRTTTAYDATGHKLNQTITAVSGARVVSTYDATTGNLKTRIAQAADGTITSNQTYADGGLANSETNDGQGKVSYTYNSAGAKTSQLQTDPDGTKTTTLYDATTGAVTKVYVANPDGSSETRAYGLTGLAWTTEVQVTDAAGKQVSLTRSAAGGRLVSTDVVQGSSKVSTAYDSQGRRQTETTVTGDVTKDGTRTVLTYDPATATLVTRVVQSAVGGTVTTSFKAGVVAQIVSVLPDGSRSTVTYDAAGKKINEVTVDTAGTWTTTVLDGTGAVSKRYIKNADGSGETQSFGITGQAWTTERSVFDAKGKVTALIRSHADGSLAYQEANAADGSRLIQTYDATGKIVQSVTIAVGGERHTTSIDAATGFTTRDIGQLVNGDVATSLYENGRLASRRTQLAAGGKIVEAYNADGSRTADTYTAAGIRTTGVVVDTAGTWTTSQYDATTGKQTFKFVERTDGTAENTIYNVTGHSYVTQTQLVDAKGAVVSVSRRHADGTLDYTETRDPDGTRTLTYYDAKGRMTKAATFGASNTETIEYDAATGTLLSRTDESGGITHSRAFDSAGRLTKDVTVNAMGQWTTLLYDQAGTVTRKYVTAPDGSAVNTVYMPAGSDYAVGVVKTDTTGKTISVDRTRADGSRVYAEVNDATGRTQQYFDVAGREQSKVVTDAAGRTTMNFDTAKDQLYSSKTELTGGGSIVRSYTAGVMTGRTTTTAAGVATTESFATAGHAIADARSAATGYDAILVGGVGGVTGSVADELLLVDRTGATVAGGGGDDRFLVTLGTSATIADFGAGHDLLDLSAFAKSGYQPMMEISGNDLTVKYDQGATITLTGAAAHRLVQTSASSGVYAFG
ncbi:beta strand repeat-containing protein [Sphingomonas sp. M1A8_2b]